MELCHPPQSRYTVIVQVIIASSLSDANCGQIVKLIPTTAAPSYAGYVDVPNCQTISGWAPDRNQPNQSINVSIYDGSTLVATIAANQSRPDVGGFLGDNGLHGFTYTIPASLKDPNSHNVHVVFGTNSALDLGGSPTTLSCGANYAGYVDTATCTSGVSGWTADRTRLNQPINVTLWDGATQIASALANASRPDVGAFIGDNGLHGFSIPVPAAYRNILGSNLQVRFESFTSQLAGSPLTLDCRTPNLAGWLDTAGCSAVVGWAADRNRPNVPLTVDLVEGSSVLASRAATFSRPDVGAVLGDNGLHGFIVTTPQSLKDGAVHSVQVRYGGASQQINNSPQNLQCAGTGASYAGYVDSLSCSSVFGWAADRNSLNTSINVEVYDGTARIASGPAASARGDVGVALGDNGIHAFSIVMPASIADGKAHTITVRPAGSSVVLAGKQSLTCP